jgi:hypothetical protein
MPTTPELLGEDRPGQGRTKGALAGAERQEHFFAEGVFELLKLQGRLTLVAQHFEDGGTTLFGDFHARILQMYDVHLKGLDEKILAVSATGTRQGHSVGSLLMLTRSAGRVELYGMGSGESNDNLDFSANSTIRAEKWL